jgi:hypothetical protein
MTTMTIDEFMAACKAQGVPIEHVALKCPMCGTLQSGVDLISVGAGKTFDDVEKYLGFSCIGRFDSRKPPVGCDWSLGGLFQLHKLEVITEDGVHHPRFELATPGEAQSHMAAVLAQNQTKQGATA